RRCISATLDTGAPSPTDRLCCDFRACTTGSTGTLCARTITLFATLSRSAPAPMRRRSRWNGFTLIEMLLTMIVVGLLAAVSVPRYRAVRERAYMATMEADLHSLRLAEEMYFAEHGEYAVSVESLGFRPSEQVA